jgi:beta-glucosidase
MTIDEKIGIVSGVGTFSSRCTGNTSPVQRLGIPSICFNDGPAGYPPSLGLR